MTLIDTDGSSAAGSCGATLRTSAERLAVAVSLVPPSALAPVPRTVTVRRTVWFAFDDTAGRVQVGVAELELSSVPPSTLQEYSTAPSYAPPVSVAPSRTAVPSSPDGTASIDTDGAVAAGVPAPRASPVTRSVYSPSVRDE